MYITKQAEQDIFNCSKKSYDGAPPKKQIHTQLPKLALGKLPWKLTKRFHYFCFWNGNLGVCPFSGLNS